MPASKEAVTPEEPDFGVTGAKEEVGKTTRQRSLISEPHAEPAVKYPTSDAIRVKNYERTVELAIKHGWVVLDIPNGEKSPGRRGWQHERNYGEVIREVTSPLRNTGVFPGEPSNGLVDCDQDRLELARLARRFLPKSGMRFGRPSKPGGHILYRCDDPPPNLKFLDPLPVAEGGMGTIGEIRSQPSVQTVLPGSLHRASGEIVVWEESSELTPVDAEQLVTTYSWCCAVVLLAHHWPAEGARHVPALVFAGAMARSGRDPDEVGEILEFVWPTAERNEIANIIESTQKKLEAGENVTGWPRLEEYINPSVVRTFRKWLGIEGAASRPPLTDFGNADRFVMAHGPNVKYVPAWNRWLIWTGIRWTVDEKEAVRELGKEVIRGILTEAAALTDDTQRQNTAKWALQSAKNAAVNSMLNLVQSVPSVVALPSDFDQQPWLLNVANGTLDLREMVLREARREDLLTKMAPVAYDSEATCPTWDRFIETVTCNREGTPQPELAGFLQRLVGYMLTGIATEKILPISYGPGDTGKTTFSEVLLALLGGDYAVVAPESTIAKKYGSNDSIPNDIARLRGARLVLVSETSEDFQLNEGRIKAMTGRSVMTARFLHQEFFEFVPEFKLLIETNHRPRIKGTDDAIWNRIRLIPFENVIPKEQQDRRLPEKLKAELSGILNWALAGCADWQRNWQQGGLHAPAIVENATDEYRIQSDQLLDFLTECCEVGGPVRTRSSLVYAEYRRFAEERGFHPLGDQRFSAALKERGYEKLTRKGYPVWVGIAIRKRPEDRLQL